MRTNKNDNEDLFISAQMRTGSLVLLNEIQEGIMYRFKEGKSLIGNITDDCPELDLTPCPSKHVSENF